MPPLTRVSAARLEGNNERREDGELEGNEERHEDGELEGNNERSTSGGGRHEIDEQRGLILWPLDKIP